MAWKMDHANPRIRDERHRGLRGRLADLRPWLYLYHHSRKRHKIELARSRHRRIWKRLLEHRQRFADLIAQCAANLLDHAVVLVAQENFSQSLGRQAQKAISATIAF